MMRHLPPAKAEQGLAHAHDLMTRALAILDDANAPGTIGSALDLAIAKLAKLLGRTEPPAELGVLAAKVERALSEADRMPGQEPSLWKIPQC